MNRDPLYQKILDALARRLDGNTFQQCASAIIGKTHRNLAPMPGGNDAGMDGAFGTSDGRYPLICTVQPDVIGNFRQNISTYLRKHDGPRLAAIATSQFLSNAKKRNLEDEAAKLGVRITNIYDGPYFTDQLYRDAKWRLALLGITGDSPALSALPRVGRFVKPEVLVGRGEELTWLRQIQADALLVGRPGSGKTYLHQHLASEGLCLFAVDESPQRLADAIREQNPLIIVVDDAHVHLGFVETLKRLRAELDASYHIHVNCWPNHNLQVQRVLGVPDQRVLELQPLRRPDIFELIRQSGIGGPDWLQHFLISQAEGKPGLAVALAEVCKIEGVSHIWSGDAAARQLLGDLRLVRDEQERCVLAAFAIGGDAGMSFRDVSTVLELPQFKLRTIITELGSGGLIDEVADDRLQVRPPAIRAVLVRDVFYSGPTSLEIGPLLERIPSVAKTAVVMLDARQRGAKIDRGILERLVTAAGSPDVWERFAWLDAECCTTILDKHPAHICDAAPGLLNHSAARALHALLDADEASTSEGTGAVKHPRRRISDWLFPHDLAEEVTIERRLTTLSVLEERVRHHKIGSGKSLTWALSQILRATVDATKRSPRSNREIVRVTGVASFSVANKIVGMWPRMKALVERVPNTAARIFFDRVEDWCLPQRFSLLGRLSTDTDALIRSHGRQMLSDLLGMPNCNRAWRTRAAWIAKWGKLGLEIDVDPTFDALYADRDLPNNWQEQQIRRTSELQAIADDLQSHGPEAVVEVLGKIRSEAEDFQHQHSNGQLPVVYGRIAGSCSNPDEWLSTLVKRRSPVEFIVPFLWRLSSGFEIQFELAIDRLLECIEYQHLAIAQIIQMPAPSEAFLETAIALLHDNKLAEGLSVRGETSVGVMARLLDHPNSAVRAAAAIGEWQRQPTGTIRDELAANWRQAILEVDPRHYVLIEIFENDATLAFEWLQSQLQSSTRRLSAYDSALHDACKALVREQRETLLLQFNSENYGDDCFDIILGEHIDIFVGWLKHQTNTYLRLKPLDRDVGPRWEQLAILALDAGVSADDLAEHCTPDCWSASATYFAERIPVYEALASHADPRLRLAGTRGLEIMRSRAARAKEQELQEEIYGD